MNSRRIKITSLPVAEDGTLDLPDEAVIVAIDFADEGSLGLGRRPAMAWLYLRDEATMSLEDAGIEPESAT